ncbi:MAG: hypothetical protein MMC23_008706 [Stictis urceolatum]|nr:hypothetical protein [Stictis urceolata]
MPFNWEPERSEMDLGAINLSSASSTQTVLVPDERFIREQQSAATLNTPNNAETTHQFPLDEEGKGTPPSDDIVVAWDGPSDPHNPRNWPTAKKMLNVAIVSALGFLT